MEYRRNNPTPPALGSNWLYPEPTTPALCTPFGIPAKTAIPVWAATRPPVRPAIKERSTFYSFHYRDIFRVNHIRNAGAIRPQDRERLPTPRDRSLWESRKTTNPAALAAMINRGLSGTTVTAVLAGYETWQREWVRYEIARSLARSNGLLTVYLDGCQCPNEGFAPPGPNPLSFIALGWNLRIYEQDPWGNWILYSKIRERLPAWPKWLPRASQGRVMPLSEGAPAFDWINDNGRYNLVRWTDEAAAAAGR